MNISRGSLVHSVRSFYGGNPTMDQARMAGLWVAGALLVTLFLPYLLPSDYSRSPAFVRSISEAVAAGVPLIGTLAEHSKFPVVLKTAFALQLCLLPGWFYFYGTRGKSAVLRPDGFKNVPVARSFLFVLICIAISLGLLFGEVSAGAFTRPTLAGRMLRLVAGYRYGIGLGTYLYMFMLVTTAHLIILWLIYPLATMVGNSRSRLQ